MWAVKAEEIKNIGRTPGGDRFTEFINSLIYSWGYSHGLQCSKIYVNQRTNKQDGGVDTEVCEPIPNDQLGWMENNPTIWQYKASDSSDISDDKLRSDVKKWYATECIIRGYAYRFCICDSLPSYKRKSWEEILNTEIKKINPSAPDVKVLTVDDLAQWASRIPAIKMRYFPEMATLGLHFSAWGESVTEITPEFVKHTQIESIMNRIQSHANFALEVPGVILPISGLSGVGKTRLVYESLSSCEGSKSLTIFTNDEDKAVDISTAISNNSTISAILVADECGVDKRLKIKELLKGHKDRVRVIVIDNSGERPNSVSPEPWLEKMLPKVVEEILEKNYPNVPFGRRRAYAELSSGFVRFAADLCRNDSMIASVGSTDPILKDVRDYLRTKRFSPEELKIIQALSLINRVGYKGDVSEELSVLCEIVNEEQGHFKEIAGKLCDGPGFVSRAGRYYYVTPELIAQAGFDLAWNSWVKEDPQHFLEKLPKILLEPFYARVRISASSEVRVIIGDYFRGWSTGLRPEQLYSVETVNRLITLIEVEPRTYLPVLRNLIEQATIDDLKKLSGENIRGGYGPRRSIVWLAERIVAFPEYFDDAENILLRLGLAESEKNIVNNATAIWIQLYRIVLSGTAVPFLSRLKRLETRILSGYEEISHFAIGAIDGILDDDATRIAGPSIIAGKIPPEEYIPKDSEEYIECKSATIKLLSDIIDREEIPEDIKQKAKSVIAENTRILLNNGFVDELRDVLIDERLDDELRVKLIENIELFLHFDTKEKWGRPALREEYVEKVNEWLTSLKPSDFRGRISMLVGTHQGHLSMLDKDDKMKSEIELLAKEFIQYPENLKSVEEVVFSPKARNAVSLGYSIGNLDEKATFLDFVIEASKKYNSAEFGRGYISGLLSSHPYYSDLINKKLDEFQEKNPELAYELFMTRIELTHALDRTLKLVDSGKLRATYLERFVYGKDEYLLTVEDFKYIFQRLLDAVDKGDTLALQAALEFVSFRIFLEKDGKIGKIFEADNIRSLAWRLIEITPEKNKSYQWVQTLEALSKYDLPKAIKFMALGLVEGRLHNIGEFDSFLISLTKSNPDLLMKSVGEIILDKTLGWKFQILEYKLLFKTLPEETVIEWVKEHGVEAARLIARHLPSPYISKEDLPIIPHLTQFVLDTFEDDEKVFNAFVCGVHAFQVYSGDIAAQHDKEAEIAKKFLRHSSKRIRDWAQIEVDLSLSAAEKERQFEEECRLG